MWFEIGCWVFGLLCAVGGAAVRRRNDLARRRNGEWSTLQGVTGKFSEETDSVAIAAWARNRPMGGLISGAAAGLQLLSLLSWSLGAWWAGWWWLAAILAILFVLTVVTAFRGGRSPKTPRVRQIIE